jgi:hypothetical protein
MTTKQIVTVVREYVIRELESKNHNVSALNIIELNNKIKENIEALVYQTGYELDKI